MSDITMIIATIGRPTLANAISSAVQEGLPVIVVGDGVDVSDAVQKQFDGCDVRFARTGRKFGCYGAMAVNLGILLSETPYISGFGDDDELAEGKGAVLLNKIAERPEIDIWIPNITFNPSVEWYVKKEVRYGFTPCPILRTEIITQCPMLHPPHEKLHHALDYMAVERAVNTYGYKIDWINDQIYKIRPNYKESYGAGSLGNIDYKMI